MAGRRRPLTTGERRLWAEIARSVTPLPGKSVPEPPPAPSSERPSETVGEVASSSHQIARLAPPRLKPLVAPLERKAVRALARGVRAADASLDLHGLTQAEAHRRLLAFLQSAQWRGHRLVLVVTGKGNPAGGWDGSERGILRRMVPHWLSLPDARNLVVGWQEAGPRQGGAGALYVRLRRADPRA